MSEFRQLATPVTRGDVLATATLDEVLLGRRAGSVQVWSVERQAPEAQFDTVLDLSRWRASVSCRA